MRMHPAPRLLVFIFILVIIILVFGAAWYKKSLETVILVPDSTSTQQTKVENAIELPPATLLFSPLSDNQYQVSVEGLVQPVTGVSITLTGSDQIISSSTISISSELENQGWSTAFNNSSDSETGQTLSFSIIKISTEEEILIPSLILGTITLEENANLSELTLDTSKSKVVYTSDQTSTINLTIGTDTINN